MHILLIHQAFATVAEPGGTRHHEIARYLSARGHKVTIIASPISYLTGDISQGEDPQEPEQTAVAGIRIIRAYTYPALHRSFIHRVFSFLSFMITSFFIGLSVREVDLVWGTSPPIFQSITAWLLARLNNTPFLLEIRDLWPAFAIQVGVLRQPFLVRASEWLEKFLYQHADRVIVNSPGFIDHVTARGAGKVDVVPNGADTQMFDPQARGEDFRQENQIQDKFIALYAGAHGLSNDLGVVLEAAQKLEDREEILILLLGDGKEKPALQARAKAMQLRNVKFLPPIPKMKIPAALAAADACIAILKPIPLYGTVYPNKVFDYMAAGRPVILAMQGVIQEVIESAGAGIPVLPGDPASLESAIRHLADHPELRAQMGSDGREYVLTHFDRPAQAEKFIKILENMIELNKV
ncbi:MAG: glycosyltransferase family 4 protein [Chloroflexota bacterium]|nr:MAG: glycosyltransferase family 4 protein [Chloroflexota bacterium]